MCAILGKLLNRKGYTESPKFSSVLAMFVFKLKSIVTYLRLFARFVDSEIVLFTKAVLK